MRTRRKHNFLAGGAAARTSAGRKHYRVSPGQQHRDIIGRGRLQVTDDSFGAALCTSAIWAGFLASPTA